MKKILVMLSAICCFALCLQQRQIGKLRQQRDRYKQNTETALGEAERYKSADSLNVVRITALRLTLDELKRYRAEDAQTIERLRMKGRDVKGIESHSTATNYSVTTIIRDTLLQRDTIKVNARCVDYHDAWLDFSGCMEADTFRGDIRSRDTLYIFESVKRKRFLGFLWKTKRIKERTWDCFCRNPHADIITSQHTTID